MSRLIRILTVLVALTAAAPAAVVAVNPLMTEPNLPTERVRDMLLGRITTWQDGSPVIIILIDDPAADAALEIIAGRDRSRLIRGWKRLVYAGTGAMPQLYHGVTEGLAAVSRHPGSLAIVPQAVPGDRWRMITLDRDEKP
jgi:hypothetical protein